MHFTTAEYSYFRDWYLNDLRYGLYAFYFPRIDTEDKSVLRTYRFTAEGAPKYSNAGGNIISVSMEWEEV